MKRVAASAASSTCSSLSLRSQQSWSSRYPVRALSLLVCGRNACLPRPATPPTAPLSIGSHIGGVVGQKGQHLKLIVAATHVSVDVDPIYPPAPPQPKKAQPASLAPAAAAAVVVEAKQPRYRSRFDDGTSDSEEEEARAVAAAAQKAKEAEEAAAAAEAAKAAAAAEAAVAAAAAAARPLAEAAAVRLEGPSDCVLLVQVSGGR
jgi:hypothetical protein